MADQLKVLAMGIPLNPLPSPPPRDTSIPHAPKRVHGMKPHEKEMSLHNALRYFPKELHSLLAPEFAAELEQYGHIYMYRFRPVSYAMKAYPIDQYPAKSRWGAAAMLMIMNNLDPAVAQFPHELVVYGGQGSAFQNWAQYLLVMKYLSALTEDQTLVLYSGHPLGLFPAPRSGPRMVITNGLVVSNYSKKEDYERFYGLGVSQYGQMTAGSFVYIGPQGTTLTILNAGRKYLGSSDLSGKVYISSGLGGMSGAQPKAATICGAISVTAEINAAALNKRKAQGWLHEAFDNLDALVDRIRTARSKKEVVSIGYLGNVVDLWEKLANTGDMICELASDQTSCHNVFGGGYYPVGLSMTEADDLRAKDMTEYKKVVQASLVRHVNAINKLVARGLKFWDYGNSFLLEASRAGADIVQKDTGKFIYPSYVEDIMGDIFSLGFGPFRWICTSCDPKDLAITDQIAEKIMMELAEKSTARSCVQYEDSLRWIRQAASHKLVVGSQARILYADARGRVAIAQAFNDAIRNKTLSAPVMLSRDHHDVSGTDSPYRETSNIRDGSMYTADMSVHNCIGDSFRGATWVALHNGGGTGIGEASNGGFGLLMDGTEDAHVRADQMLSWDVYNGIARRAWARNDNALETIQLAMDANPLLRVTLPNKSDDDVVKAALSSCH